MKIFSDQEERHIARSILQIQITTLKDMIAWKLEHKTADLELARWIVKLDEREAEMIELKQEA
jgi:hypothetical protein